MKEMGIISSVDGDKVFVSFQRKSGCGDSCASCKSKCGANFITTEVFNNVNAKVGDKVNVEIENKSFNKMMFFAYILPLIMMIIGTVTGSSVFRKIGYENYELFGFFVGVVFLASSYYILKIINDKMNRDKKQLLKITKIIK
jgi:sigma-E factor negative regulatory protein RseC